MLWRGINTIVIMYVIKQVLTTISKAPDDTEDVKEGTTATAKCKSVTFHDVSNSVDFKIYPKKTTGKFN